MLATPQIKVKKVEKTRIHEVDFSDIPFGKVYSDHMVMADYIGREWTNISIIPYDSLKLMPGCSCLHYGQSIFEGLKAYRSQSGEILAFRPWDNLKRMNISAERMCMPSIPEEMFIGGIKEPISSDSDLV